MSTNDVRSSGCGVRLLSAGNFFGRAGAMPSRKQPLHHSPFATRYSLPFSVRREPRAPDFLSDALEAESCNLQNLGVPKFLRR